MRGRQSQRLFLLAVLAAVALYAALFATASQPPAFFTWLSVREITGL